MLAWALLLLCSLAAAHGGETPSPLILREVAVPRLGAAPSLEDFLSMQPRGAAAEKMLRVTGFVQRAPHDGEAPSQQTDVYLGYDHKNFYAVFVCFDREPGKVRAHLSRREDIFDDDTVELMLDTFQDQRRAYSFQVNPLGVQWDAIWTEVERQGVFDSDPHFDISFDTLWYSRGKLTPQGFVAWMAIPFRSLRFTPGPSMRWGVVLNRSIVRENEDDFWPEISRKVEGRLNQAGAAKGLEGISPGRNMQFIPYGVFRSFRAPDFTASAPSFQQRDAQGRFGLDSKFIFHDNLVLDVTANPDFSEVESDDPQVTVNQRFEVFFPEKRPFFQENSDFFRTPINLFFTRRIGNPSAGVRLTGKVGPYSLGVLAADDRDAGAGLPASSPLFGERAYFTVARVNRELPHQSSVGAIYTDWELPFDGEFNRIGGVDTRLKFGANWTARLQSVVSSTRHADGSYQAGPASLVEAAYTGSHLEYFSRYTDISPGFTTAAGFVNRVDVRDLRQAVSYQFRPKHSWVLSWEPSFNVNPVWAHDGTRLDTFYSPFLQVTLKHRTFFSLEPYTTFRERLRPQDFFSLSTDRDYHEHLSGASLTSTPVKLVTFTGQYYWGSSLNFVPPGTAEPFVAHLDSARAVVTLRPMTTLKIDNSYLFNRLRLSSGGASIFNNHIVRSKWNWQFTRELSLRMILQYTSTLTNPAHTFLPTSKQFNADFLVTYLVHPGTAIYVGYNSDLLNLDPNTFALRPENRLINDSRQFFVKASYLLRF